MILESTFPRAICYLSDGRDSRRVDSKGGEAYKTAGVGAQVGEVGAGGGQVEGDEWAVESGGMGLGRLYRFPVNFHREVEKD
jgi:hypothetical protein